MTDRPSANTWLYHDESWPQEDVLDLTGHGVLIVDAGSRKRVFDRLQSARGSYVHEIKFGKIDRDNRKAQLFQVAKKWVEIAFDELGTSLAFKASFTDHKSPYFQAPYPGDPRWAHHVKHSTSLPGPWPRAISLRGLRSNLNAASLR